MVFTLHNKHEPGLVIQVAVALILEIDLKPQALLLLTVQSAQSQQRILYLAHITVLAQRPDIHHPPSKTNLAIVNEHKDIDAMQVRYHTTHPIPHFINIQYSNHTHASILNF